ncbi:head-tail adaptor [Mycobacterium phage Cornie]|uniref:Tail terminator n=1 Tax=Mycobacterium phage Cornie TaxID=2704043 RepID=A0A6G6XJV0_9CAUD|nr:head-tail adaptor [Mycobacterium phage Cornie]QIG58389.1 hypothetical protein SEA_CORNIE_11 [Mycobacterium phage Cornie]
MTEDAPDAEDFVICWLQPEQRAAVERNTNDVVVVVTRISGPDCPEEGTDDPVIQLDWYGHSATEAKQLSTTGHRRMTLQAVTLDNVTLSDGSTANADYVRTLIKPFRMSFPGDELVRYTARYQLGLSYVTVD